MAGGTNIPIWPLGPVPVPVPGTIVGLLDGADNVKFKASAMAQLPDGAYSPGQQPVFCAKVGFVVPVTNVGLIYLGVKGMDKTTGEGVIMVFPIGSADPTKPFTWDLKIGVGRNDIRPEDYYVDADTADDYIIATVYQAGTR